VVCYANLNNHEYGITCHRDRSNRREKDYMVARVTPIELFSNFPAPKYPKIASECIPDILAICKCLDKTIHSTPGVDLVYWCFRWRKVISKSVWTLEELSWDE
jgi:hypothetical protein